ncbi:MAG: hypothetical protein MJ198_01565 [Bacteroidales bacterium]|nr:hypothetical protein [Bacteroidales bacterium]
MKKLFAISAFALAAIVACNKEEVKTPQVTDEDSQIVLKSINASSGDICVSVRVNTLGDEYDSCFTVGVPFVGASVVKDKVIVKVGEGENQHDSVVYLYQSAPIPQEEVIILCDTCR